LLEDTGIAFGNHGTTQACSHFTHIAGLIQDIICVCYMAWHIQCGKSQIGAKGTLKSECLQYAQTQVASAATSKKLMPYEIQL
jgi:hypothetical protein